jgi:hypothetical protein
VLAYPGAPDSDYAAILAGYRRLCRGEGEGTVESTVPTFHEVIVMDEVAIARLTWTTRLRGMPAGATRKLTDFQVWRRGKKGWEFVRGVHYPARRPG